MMRRGALVLAAAVSGLVLAGCEGLPESASGVSRPVTFDGTEYTVDFAVREVTEVIASSGGATEARFDASIIDIVRTDGQPMQGIGPTEAIAIASAFCEAYGLPKAPAAGTVSQLPGQWRVQNHCGSAFG
ncbi:dsRNA-binding motif domain-containing protein [Marinibacterium profundimaris]|uniref:Lipoprotein n=1 Tax=Marinibacterium profundimaris TaxID=1679460 RepID=A0A225P113_9RHOB|nr:hypothetical protein [Marinibacterium profundimaris]OWU77896.1 hypothetical protein ATO3_04490 [Marinibacterium profundimaris]